jgi:multidrug resistance efflux pump
VAAAEAHLQKLYSGPDEESLIAARAAMRKAEAVVATAQAAYDAVAWRNDVGMLPESAQLQQASIDLEAAKANYNALARGADPAAISASIADVETARADLARTLKPVQAGEIAAAQAELRQAEAQLALLQAGSRVEAIQASQAAVTAAQATLMAAEVALSETVLTSPFVGTVAALEVEVGEQVEPGLPVVQLGDFSIWQLETDDLVELDVVRVKPGAPVAITVDALPELDLRGRVERVKPIGENKVGDMTYTAYIALENPTAALAWNMTATVYIGGAALSE